MSEALNVPPRDLTDNERAALRRVLKASGRPGADILLRQVPSATVVGGIPTQLTLAVEGAPPCKTCPDGLIPVRAFVVPKIPVHALPEVGVILVCVEDGYLKGLEYA